MDSKASGMRVPPYTDPMHRRCALFEKRLGAYLEHPGTSQIHDLRTSIRRMESTYDALPRSAKTAHSRKFFERAKSLFRRSGPVRDADVIAGMLTGLGVHADSRSVMMLSGDRTARLEATAKAAMAVAKMGAPLTNPTGIGKIAARRKKSMWNLFDEIRQMSRVVASDESDVTLLHSMRKKVKRLRYLLEDEIGYCNALGDSPADSACADACEYDGYRDALSCTLDSIENVQKSAGFIHDCDIAIRYVTEHYQSIKDDGARPADLLDALQKRRHLLYLELVGRDAFHAQSG